MDKLAKRVYFNHGAYFYVDAQRKWHKLGRTPAEALRKLAELGAPQQTMDKVIDRYVREVLPKKAPKTVKDQKVQAENLKRSFGKNNPAGIESSHIYIYHQARSQSAPVMANRELSLLQDIFRYAKVWGIRQDNPVQGVPRNQERPRERCPTDSEFVAVYRMAPVHVRAAMRLGRLTGQREAKILELNQRQLTPDGILWEPAKGGKKMIMEWTPALGAAIRFCGRMKVVRPGRDGEPDSELHSVFLIRKRNGQPYSESGFQSAWQVLMRKYAKSGGERFTFHDLRRKSASESPDGQHLGHQNLAVTERIYRVLPRKVKPLK